MYIAHRTLLLNCRFVKLHRTPPLWSVRNQCSYSVVLIFNGENCKTEEKEEREKKSMITSPSIWRVQNFQVHRGKIYCGYIFHLISCKPRRILLPRQERPKGFCWKRLQHKSCYWRSIVLFQSLQDLLEITPIHRQCFLGCIWIDGKIEEKCPTKQHA